MTEKAPKVITPNQRHRIRTSPLEKTFTILIYGILGFLGLMCLLPFVHLIALSFSGSAPVKAGKVTRA